MQATVKNTRIAGICTAVPRDRINFFDAPDLFPSDEMERLFANTGIAEIRVAPNKMIVSDMCCAAAERLMEKLGWERSSIDLIILVTQGPDVPLPATACLIQNRLGLPTTCAAFDVNLGCSGYVYGLWMASQMLTGMKKGRALLLVGDKSTGGAFGLVIAQPYPFWRCGCRDGHRVQPGRKRAYYIAGTDGKGASYLNLKAGRDRYPILVSETGLPPDDYERLMRDTKVHLSGGEVFAFTLRIVPPLIRDVLAFAGIDDAGIDHYVFHQANKFIP